MTRKIIKTLTTMKMIIKRGTILSAMMFVMSAAFACNYNSFETPNANAAASAAENSPAAFESDLRTMETANLKNIFVVRRTDGGAFNAEDRKYLRENLPTTNRVIMSDEGRAFIVGSNYKFPAENVVVLRLRFKVEQMAGEKPIELEIKSDG